MGQEILCCQKLRDLMIAKVRRSQVSNGEVVPTHPEVPQNRQSNSQA